MLSSVGPAGAIFFVESTLFFRHNFKKMHIRIMRTNTPPTIPPIIAPTELVPFFKRLIAFA
jgi:hypothetical protein